MSETNPENPTDLTWQTHMKTLMWRKKLIEAASVIDTALFEYYSEKGLEVPQWKKERDTQWWVDYLSELGLGPNNTERNEDLL